MRNLISKLVKTCVEIQLAIDEPIISKALETKGMDATSREALRGSVRNSLNAVPEIAAKASESVIEFSNTPLGIGLAPSFPLLLQKPMLSAAQRLFFGPYRDIHPAEDHAKILLRGNMLEPPLEHKVQDLEGLFGKGCSRTNPNPNQGEVCQNQGQAGQSELLTARGIHPAEDHAKKRLPSNRGDRPLEQEFQGLPQHHQYQGQSWPKPPSFLEHQGWLWSQDPGLELPRDAER